MPWVESDGRWQWCEPEFTLGWEIISWAETNFKVPGGKFYGQPLKLSGWQAMFLLDWYAVDRAGAWLFSRGLAQLSKKIGKSPVGGVVTAADYCGPSQFDGWDAAGNPVGRRRPAPWLQIAAVSEDQTANTYSPFMVMMRESPLPDELKIDVGATMTIFRGNREAKVEIVTSAAGSREGQPITGAIGDEGQSWRRSNGGTKLYRTLRRNTAPMGGRVLVLANAFEPGAESVAEAIAVAAGSEPTSLVYGPQYEVRDTDLANEAQVVANLSKVYRDAPWVDVQSVARDVMTADQDPAEVQRFYFNWPVAADSTLCESPPLSADELEPYAPVAVGFDGSRTQDATALVVVHMVTGVAYLAGYWERPWGASRRERWEVPRAEVSAAVEAVFARFRVARMKADPSHWQDELSSWQNRYTRDVVDRFPVWQDSVVDNSVEATQTALMSGAVKLEAGESLHAQVLRAHVQRAKVHRRMARSRTLRSLAKPEDGARIDAAAALTYAVAARLEALAKGWSAEQEQDVSPFVLFG